MRVFCFALFVFLAAACQPEFSERPEHLAKLRTLGVSSNPLVLEPSTEDEPKIATLTIHAMVPSGQTVKAEVFDDAQAVYALPISDLTLVEGSETYSDEFTNLTLYTVDASFLIPPADLFEALGTDVVRLRYGVRLTAADQEEKIVGDVLLRPEGSAELKWKAPKISIVAPTEGKSITKYTEVDLLARTNLKQGERVKIGWFVSGGEVKNRRALATKWSTAGEDKQLVLATVRGISSRGFGYVAIEYKARSGTGD